MKIDKLMTGNVRLNRDGVRGIVRGFIRPILGLFVLLVSSGTIGWINAWIYIGMRLLYHVTYVGLLMTKNPGLLNQRGRVKKNTKTFDKVILISFVPLSFLIQIVCGLDAVRFEWSGMSLGFVVFGAVIWVLGISFTLWSMVANPHFEASVRIQEDRNQRVFTSGPYGIVRHPGYLGFILVLLGVPFILGSWWGLVPSSVFAITVMVRTDLEDRMLKGELSGYSEYAKETRHRLIPLVW
ncbi:MAG: isoprenylcysteine carboxylmethyltransferase family protein [Deltaproteobacteria bacterium]|uniref:Isoprenylcysteine carboxylmethyltransferase family protein n=1 Tax=Candidatus Zymogenus saltonus TaxID=2844893 RepID=A0A9D8KFX9_9DELT|nr:isoprenylcysteine carboxylmethyltransferase family protein [Candidatus Zymogenus saltonus]